MLLKWMFAGRNLQSSNSPPEEHFFSTRMPSCPAALVHYGRFFFVDHSDNSFYLALGLLSSATSCKSPQCNHDAYCFGDFNTPLEKLHFIDPIFLDLGFVWVCRDLFFLTLLLVLKEHLLSDIPPSASYFA